MENKQDGKKSKARPKGNNPDERQLDLWSLGGAAPSPAVAQDELKTVAQVPDSHQVSARSLAPAPTSEVAPKAALSAPEARQAAAAASPAAAPLEADARRTAENAKPPVQRVRSLATPSVSGSAALPALTRRQHDLLIYLRERRARGERAPSLGEICKDLGLASRGSLHKQVVALVESGLVEAMNGKQRGVRLIDAANDADGAVPMLGAIAAGRPIEALIRDETVTLPAWLRVPGPCYALRVKGDSMRDAGILDGDVVVVEQRQHARNGETVVALIDGESATLKRIEQTPGEIVLHAENPAYAPQRYRPEQVAIQGVLVAALRRY